MRKFKIFQHPTGGQEAVKQAWSCPSFFFGAIWALAKKLWGLDVMLFVIVLFLSTVPVETESGILTTLIMLVVYIVCGVNGNSWRETNLKSQGYDYIDTVSPLTLMGRSQYFSGPSGKPPPGVETKG